jgi:hypothetical protein
MIVLSPRHAEAATDVCGREPRTMPRCPEGACLSATYLRQRDVEWLERFCPSASYSALKIQCTQNSSALGVAKYAVVGLIGQGNTIWSTIDSEKIGMGTNGPSGLNLARNGIVGTDIWRVSVEAVTNRRLFHQLSCCFEDECGAPRGANCGRFFG